jgi:membrane protein
VRGAWGALILCTSIMATTWKLGDLTGRRLCLRIFRKAHADDIPGQAAKLSYYFLLALFPLLIFLTTVFGYFAQSSALRDELLAYFRRVVPGTAFRLVVSTMQQIAAGANRGKLSFGLIGTIFAASGGMTAMVNGLNRAYGVDEGRSWWKVRLIGLGLTIAFAILIVTALLLVLLGPHVGERLAHYVGYHPVFSWAWNAVSWIIVFLVVLFAIDLLYRFAPDLKRWNRSWTTPGAVAAVLLWILLSYGLRVYVRYVNSYGATYGSLGSVIILMLWFYLTGMAILMGAEINAELENAAARSGGVDSRLPAETNTAEQKKERVG